MNTYKDIIAALDKHLRKRGATEESKQVAAMVVALAHRVQKDFELAGKKNPEARPRTKPAVKRN